MEECTRRTRNSRVKVAERSRVAVFLNDDRHLYRVSLVDGCIIKDGIRSDYIVSKDGDCSIIVELKGCNVRQACAQLMATVDNVYIKKLLEKRIGFLVICSRYPRIDGVVMKAKQIAMSKYKAGFHVVCHRGEFDIDRVVAINGPR